MEILPSGLHGHFHPFCTSFGINPAAWPEGAFLQHDNTALATFRSAATPGRFRMGSRSPSTAATQSFENGRRTLSHSGAAVPNASALVARGPCRARMIIEEKARMNVHPDSVYPTRMGSMVFHGASKCNKFK